MNKFIVFTRTRGGFKQVPAIWLLAAVLPLAAVGAVAGGLLWSAFNGPAQANVAGASLNDDYQEALIDLSGNLNESYQSVKNELETTRGEAEAQLGLLAHRVAKLQARVVKMETLAREMAKADNATANAVDFASPIAVGGPDSSLPEASVEDVVAQLALLETRVEDRQRQLQVLESLMLGEEMTTRLTPKGRPIVEGWLSSAFGSRKDPFSGKRKWHSGIDFAAPEDGAIVAVADGVVSYAGRRSGYGLMIEITHADGYATRYGHNKANLVAVGDRVDAGSVIGRVGSSGRSTGPHVHFEVLKNGKKVNPTRYVASSR